MQPLQVGLQISELTLMRNRIMKHTFDHFNNCYMLPASISFAFEGFVSLAKSLAL